MVKRWLPWTLAVVLLGAAIPALAQTGRLEIFSWWAGDEGPALEALIRRYNQLYPQVTVENATVTGGAGVVAKAVLKTRMLGGEPPDSFQVHAGQELIGTWVVANRMEDLTFLFRQEGWMDKFPPALLEQISTPQGIWSVPVNIHRSNVMWYRPEKLREWGVQPPRTWDDFLRIAPDLARRGVTPLVLGESWTVQHLWESVALAVLGPDDYLRLWNRKLSFTDAKAVAVWQLFDRILAHTNRDAAGLSWQHAVDRVVQGEAAFNVMGDWAAGYMATTLRLVPGQGFGWAAAPGTSGVFMWLSDSFGLPQGARNRPNVINWLRLLGSREGQDIFNPLKGSIAARLDSDLGPYNAYLRSAANDWRTNRIVGSLVHGTVAKEAFMSEFATVMGIFLTSRNPRAAASAAQAIADQVGLGR